jgi:hypothetical protein
MNSVLCAGALNSGRGDSSEGENGHGENDNLFISWRINLH